jgi:hypothetical protein
MKKTFTLVVLCLSLIICVSANASITYEFYASNASMGFFIDYNNNNTPVYDYLTVPASFSLTVPTFVTSGSSFSTGFDSYSISTSLMSSGDASAGSVTFYMNYMSSGRDVIIIGDSKLGWNYQFSAGTFSAVGSYDTISADSNIAHLNVTESAPVPIPAAVWLLGSGLIGLIGVRRFRK